MKNSAFIPEEFSSLTTEIARLRRENEQLRDSPVLTEEGKILLADLFNARWRKSFEALETELAVALQSARWNRA